jgi:uncharacterized protein (DUF1778 family)
MMNEDIEEIARRHDERVKRGDLGELVRIKATIKSPVDIVYSTRYSSEEIALVRRAAAARHMSTSAFIRSAALAAAAEDIKLTPGETVTKIVKAQALARRLSESLDEIATTPNRGASSARKSAGRTRSSR